MLLWEIFNDGQIPYHWHSDNTEAYKAIVGGEILPKASCPDEIFDLAKSCWEEEPEQRPSFSAILSALTRNSSLSSSRPNPERNP